MTTESVAEGMLSSEALFNELKQRWHELGLPGYSSSPLEAILRLLLFKLGIQTVDQVLAVMNSFDDAEIKDLQNKNILSSYWSTSDANTVLLLKLALAENAGNLPLAFDMIAQANPAKAPEPEVVQPKVEEPVVEEVIPEPEVVAEPEPEKIEVVYKEPAAVVEVSSTEEISEEEETVAGCKHVDKDGNCVDCSKEEYERCDDCGDDIPVAKLTYCAEEDCANAYCPECAQNEANLSKHGFCDRCQEFDCDQCRNTYVNGEQKSCSSGRDCDYANLCDPCGEKLLNAEGICPECSGEEVLTCDECDEEFIESKVTHCANADCDRDYCAEHIGQLDADGLCPDCVEEKRNNEGSEEETEEEKIYL